MGEEEMIMQAAENVIKALWEFYRGRVPQARELENALRARGDTWIEDHIAFRTFPGEHVGAHVVAGIFEALGYERRDDYDFKEKKLSAFWLEPPMAAGMPHEQVLPKVFVSELRLDECTPSLRRIIESYLREVTSSPLPQIEALARRPEAAAELVSLATQYLTAGAPWRRPLLADYETLLGESEYAAWTLLFGPVPNHFTVCSHLMRTFSHLSDLNEFLEREMRVPMNRSGGGLIKGSPDIGLEQSATMAFATPVLFQETARNIPFAYIEFAHRWPLPTRANDGRWDSYYQGFVTNNADKIFESTFLGDNRV